MYVAAESLNEVLVAALVALALALVKVVEFLIKKFQEKSGNEKDKEKPGEACALTVEQAAQLKDLHSWHAADNPETGVKRWWTPPGLKNDLQAITKTLSEQNEALMTCRQAQSLREDNAALRAQVAEIQERFISKVEELYLKQIEGMQAFGRHLDSLEAAGIAEEYEEEVEGHG